MNYGEWNSTEINKAKSKAEYFIDLHQAVWSELKDINLKMYRNYVETHTAKYQKFSILAPKVLDEVTYFDKIQTHKYHDHDMNLTVRALREVPKSAYNVSINSTEINFMNFFMLNVFGNNTYNKSKELIKRLNFCTGGEIEVDDVYLLCDIDLEIKLYEECLKKYKDDLVEA